MWVDQRGSEVLQAPECRRLLAVAAKHGLVGRLAVSEEDGPPIVRPVCFAYDTRHGHAIILRLGEGSLAKLVENQVVTFEVDHLDPRRGEAWSILVRGLAFLPAVEQAAELSETGPIPLVPEPGDHIVVIRIGHTSGRRFPLVKTA